MLKKIVSVVASAALASSMVMPAAAIASAADYAFADTAEETAVVQPDGAADAEAEAAGQVSAVEEVEEGIEEAKEAMASAAGADQTSATDAQAPAKPAAKKAAPRKAAAAEPEKPSMEIAYKAVDIDDKKNVLQEGTIAIEGGRVVSMYEAAPEVEGYTFAGQRPSYGADYGSYFRVKYSESTDAEGNVTYTPTEVQGCRYYGENYAVQERYWSSPGKYTTATFAYTKNATKPVKLNLSFSDTSGGHIYEVAPIPYEFPEGTDVVSFNSSTPIEGFPAEISFTADEGVEGKFVWYPDNSSGPVTLMKSKTDPDELAAEKADRSIRNARSYGRFQTLHREVNADGLTTYYVVTSEGVRRNITEDVEICKAYAADSTGNGPAVSKQSVDLGDVKIDGSLYAKPGTGELNYLNGTPYGWVLKASKSDDESYFNAMNAKKSTYTDLGAPDFSADNMLVYDLSVWGPPKYSPSWSFVKKEAEPTVQYKPYYMTFEFTFSQKALSEQLGVEDDEELIVVALTRNVKTGVVTPSAPYSIRKQELNRADGDYVSVWLKNIVAVGFAKKHIPEQVVDGSWLQEAVNSAPDAQDSPYEIKVRDTVNLDTTLDIPAGKNIALTGKGRIVSQEHTALPLIKVARDAKLTMKGMTYQASNTERTTGHGTVADVDGALNIEDGALYGGKVNGWDTGVVRLTAGATLDMSGGSINEMDGAAQLGAAVVVNSGATFNMSGGVIRGNVNNAAVAGAPTAEDSNCYVRGGGVVLNNYYNREQAVFNMSGGEIRDNKALSGGGVNIIGDSTFTMTGGTIAANNGGVFGGGVSVTGAHSAFVRTNAAQSTFVLDGGTITGNIARKGGGIYVNSDETWLKSGNLTNNEGWEYGGGVYVSVTPRVLHMENTLITNNTATGEGQSEGMGGGIWACPTGVAQLYVTGGVAVYDNSATRGGDDLVNVGGQGLTVHLAERMLGGGKVDYYTDGAVNSFTGYGQVSGTHRMDPQKQNTPINPADYNGTRRHFAFKTQSTPEAKALAQSNAKLLVTGNTAPRGGGVGTNGDTVIGEPGETELEVSKEWNEDVAADMRKDVTVKLVLDGIEQDNEVVTLNEENNWTAKFTGFPEGFDFSHTSVIELEAPEYEVTYTGQGTAKVKIENARKRVEQEYTSIDVVKRWSDVEDADGIRPKEIGVRLLADGKEIDRATLGAEQQWEWRFHDLPKTDVYGTPIEYSVEEVDKPEGYEVTVNRSGDVVTLTNIHVPQRSLGVTKVWNDADDADGIRPDKIVVTLLANGQPVQDVELSEANGWAHVFADLPVYDDDGAEIVYMPAEQEVEGYASEANRDGSTVTFTNTHIPETAVSVQKVWDDNGDSDQIRPERIIVTLQADGEDVQTVELHERNGWAHVFENLPKFAQDGQAVIYTVVETPVEGYESTVAVEGDAFTITNKHVPETPEEPETPTTQIDEPETPKSGNEPETPKPTTPDKNPGKSSRVTVVTENETPLAGVETGDNAMAGVLTLAVLVSCAAGGAALMASRLRRKEQ